MLKNQSSVNMIDGPLVPNLLKFAIPLVLSSMLQLLFNAADVVVVGNFASENSLAAVGSPSSLVNLMTNLFIGLSTGVNILASRYLGAKDETKVHKVVHTAIFLAVLSGVLLAVVGILFTEKLLLLMKTPKEVLNLAVLYTRLYFSGMPAMMLYNFGSSLLRAKGDTKRPLYYLTLAGILNLILNLLFVVCLNLDVAGVAIATVISQCVSAFLVLNCLRHEEDCFKLKINDICFNKQMTIEVMKLGIPAGVQGVLSSLASVVVQSSVNSFGAVLMTGSAIAGNLEGFVWVAMHAFSQGAMTFTSQNIGAKNYARIGRIAFTACACACLIGLVLGSIFYLFGANLISIYDSRPEVIEAGLIRMKYVCGLYFTCGLADGMVGVIRGMGYSVAPTIVSLVGMCGIRILWVFTGFQLPQFHNPDMLFIVFPVSWVVTFMAHLVFFTFVKNKILRKREDNYGI